ncbi:MAG: hypothetical protein IPJ69_09050 [Deltaproteobacteria bacterium]|nr:MAG: hypothetical protein IPJ69_09050 [Deltaproteobacteria bacterium]
MDTITSKPLSVVVGNVSFAFDNLAAMLLRADQQANHAHSYFQDPSQRPVSLNAALAARSLAGSISQKLSHPFSWPDFINLCMQKRVPSGALEVIVSALKEDVPPAVASTAQQYLNGAVQTAESALTVGSMTLFEEKAHYEKTLRELGEIGALLTHIQGKHLQDPDHSINNAIASLRTSYKKRLERLETPSAKIQLICCERPAALGAGKKETVSLLEGIYAKISQLVSDIPPTLSKPIPQNIVKKSEQDKMIEELQSDISKLRTLFEDLTKKIKVIKTDVSKNSALRGFAPTIESDTELVLEIVINSRRQLETQLKTLREAGPAYTFTEKPPVPETGFLAAPSIPKGTDPKIARWVEMTRTSHAVFMLSLYPELAFIPESTFWKECTPDFVASCEASQIASRILYSLQAVGVDLQKAHKSLNPGEPAQSFYQIRIEAIQNIIQEETLFEAYQRRLSEREAEGYRFSLEGCPVSFVQWGSYWWKELKKHKNVEDDSIPENFSTQEQKDYFNTILHFMEIVFFLLEKSLLKEAKEALAFFGYERKTSQLQRNQGHELIQNLLKNSAGPNLDLDILNQAHIVEIDGHARLILPSEDSLRSIAQFMETNEASAWPHVWDIVAGEAIPCPKPHQKIHLMKVSDLTPAAQGWYGTLINRIRDICKTRSKVSQMVHIILLNNADESCQWMWKDLIGIIMNGNKPISQLKDDIAKWIVSNHDFFYPFPPLKNILK